ncbi:MAG: nucleotidyltransferase substrate binding protein [Desulfamplus sp.]|nr:nucleotidyltransferase substrate binding protein [Desulfamplus sp.]
MIGSEKFEKSIINFEKALKRMEDVLLEQENSIVRDATIQRFEFTYELMWKTLKVFMEDIHGIRTVSPRQVFKEAFSLSLIEEEEIFLDMIQSRNKMSHTYNEDQANEIYQKCPSYLGAMKGVFEKIS